MTTSRLVAALFLVSVTVAPLAAQERSYWLGNARSQDIMEVSPWGEVLGRIAAGGDVRACETGPSTGFTWVLIDGSPDSIQLMAGGPIFAPIVSPHYTQFHSVAFDAAGDAWVTGSDGGSSLGHVTHYSSLGIEIANYPLTAANPRGIAIDSLGNKWIAHRNSAGSVSKIDTSNVVTNHAITGASPVNLAADYRGVGNPSHIWVQCDSNGDLVELDQTGAELNNYNISADIGSSPVPDLNGNIWVADVAGDLLTQVDRSSGVVLNTYSISSATQTTLASGGVGSYFEINGLGIDTLGRILVTQRLNFGPPQPQWLDPPTNSIPTPPCEVQRVDPTTGTMETSARLEFAGNFAFGTNKPPSTPFHFATVVDPTGDADGDGDDNLSEIQNGTSPVDALSNSEFSLDTTGDSSVGGVTSINVRQVAAPSIWLVAVSNGLLAAPTTVPGFNGSLFIDPTVFWGIAGVGTSSIPVDLTSAPAGAKVFLQGVFVDGSGGFNLRQLNGISVW